jgi:hypothetical protein
MSSMSKSPTLFLSLRRPHQNPVCASAFLLSYFSSFGHTNNNNNNNNNNNRLYALFQTRCCSVHIGLNLLPRALNIISFSTV